MINIWVSLKAQPITRKRILNLELLSSLPYYFCKNSVVFVVVKAVVSTLDALSKLSYLTYTMKKTLFFPLQVSLCTVGYLYASSGITQAQITSDGTVNTQVNQDGNVAEITGGETRGGNLFHSFQDFSVPTGNEAFEKC